MHSANGEGSHLGCEHAFWLHQEEAAEEEAAEAEAEAEAVEEVVAEECVVRAEAEVMVMEAAEYSSSVTVSRPILLSQSDILSVTRASDSGGSKTLLYRRRRGYALRGPGLKSTSTASLRFNHRAPAHDQARSAVFVHVSGFF